MRRQDWIWLGFSLAACGDDGASGNALGNTTDKATSADAQGPAQQADAASDAAAVAQAEQACVHLAALLCAKVTDCANATDPDQPASLSACQADTEATLGCGSAAYLSSGYPSCQDAIDLSTCADALSASNLPDECSGVIALR